MLPTLMVLWLRRQTDGYRMTDIIDRLRKMAEQCTGIYAEAADAIPVLNAAADEIARLRDLLRRIEALSSVAVTLAETRK